MPVFVVLSITDTSATPACPTRILILSGAAAAAWQSLVESVMAMWAWAMPCGVVSLNGNAAPGARPARRELAAINWLSSPFADAFLAGRATARATITRPAITTRQDFRTFIGHLLCTYFVRP